jgi:hypothetical protein
MTDDNGRLHVPSPDYPESGFAPTRNAGYAIGEAPEPPPAGKVYVAELNTYVDEDIAAQLIPSHNPSQQEISDEPMQLSPGREIVYADEEMTDENLAALQDELEIRHEGREEILSDTFETVREELGEAGTQAILETIGDSESAPDDIVARLAESSGLDAPAVMSLMETSVSEAAPVAVDIIGASCWDSILYAAARTPDPLARRIVSDFTSGRLPAHGLRESYELWFASLPDA